MAKELLCRKHLNKQWRNVKSRHLSAYLGGKAKRRSMKGAGAASAARRNSIEERKRKHQAVYGAGVS
jgi:hypothetical protein